MNDNRIIRLQELKTITGLSAATIWRKEKENTFPKRRKISKRAVGWMHDEIDRWINSNRVNIDTVQDI